MSKDNGQAYDFSELYTTETVEVKNHNGDVVFTVVVGEITYGEKADAQSLALADVDIPMVGSKRVRKQQMEIAMKVAMKNGLSAKMSINEEITAIKSWTLKLKGEAVPVCVEALRKMPSYMSAQIVEVIEKLNPDVDEDFHSQSGSTGKK